MAALLNAQLENTFEQRTLGNTRDALLSKLLSRKVRVKEAEAVVGKAVSNKILKRVRKMDIKIIPVEDKYLNVVRIEANYKDGDDLTSYYDHISKYNDDGYIQYVEEDDGMGKISATMKKEKDATD